MGNLFEQLLVAFTAIFVIVNPLTTAFVFLSLLPQASDAKRRRIALRAVTTATAVLFAFALLGGLIFQLFNITLAAFRIAGGLILFGIGMNMLNRTEEPSHEPDEDEHSGTITDHVSIVPLAIPMISGPGSIATTMVLTTEATSLARLAMVLTAIVLTTASCYFSMVNSRHIVRYLGDTGRKVLTKLFGLILAVVAVQFVINGTLEVLDMYMRTRELVS